MRYNVRGKQTTITPALQEYVERKIGPIEEWFGVEKREAAQAHVLLSVEGQGAVHRAEVTIALPGVELRAEVKGGDMYAAIDEVVEKLERQVRRHKTKLDRALRHRGGLRQAVQAAADAAFADVATADPADEAAAPFPIRRTKRLDLKPIDVEEAILQMNLLDHQFYMFLNRETNDTELVYRRNDGTYGWLTR
ncbi:ribosome-associated translation inhibitor RaiA [Paenibacillus antri]|uniref:Ribosome hibernation promoting factor n=1 Tax=Paenibacillus antri TaxID=2582848 RepID=A0A5R9G256_9BACL|nr:ribosome-associated translation inhibitor RaiA [Paenibacillus antri]TLS50432.1 ribosome-associated translation inhibitor RaiA [Paenibacillus antri]